MEVLQSYLDGEIDAETASKVSAHLDECVDDLEAGLRPSEPLCHPHRTHVACRDGEPPSRDRHDGVDNDDQSLV